MLGQIDSGLPQAGEVSVCKVIRFVGGQDFEREVFGQGSDQVHFGFGLGCHDGRALLSGLASLPPYLEHDGTPRTASQAPQRTQKTRAPESRVLAMPTVAVAQSATA